MINSIKNLKDLDGFKALTNQSEIIHVQDINKVVHKPVNVIVDRPKRGDILCVTVKKDSQGVLLDADKQEKVWIDGLSINPRELSNEFEAIGICYRVRGNKAWVRYREETSQRWSVGERWQVAENTLMTDDAAHEATVKLKGVEVEAKFTWKTATRAAWVEAFNTFLTQNGAIANYSAEIVDPATDKPAEYTGDDKDEQSKFKNRIIINARFQSSEWYPVEITGFSFSRMIGNPVIPAISSYYIKTGFTRTWEGGCCKAKYYDYIQANQTAPTGAMTSINTVTGGIWSGNCPARKIDFESDANCQILRDNFASYDEYLEANMADWNTGKGLLCTEQPSGKEYTYRLAECTYFDGKENDQLPLYGPAYTAANISINCNGLGKGNWWLPSAAEMCDLMSDITYGTSAWNAGNQDIVNQVLVKMTAYNKFGWSALSASPYRWTASRYSQYGAYYYYGDNGFLNCYGGFYDSISVPVITLIDLTV